MKRYVFSPARLTSASWKRMLLAVIAGLSVSLIAIGNTNADLITNGDFELNGGNGQININTYVTGWSVPGGGYTFLYAPGTADTTGSDGQYGNVALWGPGNGSSNGLPATSPAGGYFVAQDSAFQQAPIQQTVNGLITGQTYQVGFYWGAAQQSGFTGGTDSQWQVSLGSQTQSTAFASIPSEGFSGWMHQTFNFTATSSSEVLSFFANGSGAPPFALLDGVSLNPATPSAPEPSSLALMAIGLVSVGVARLRRRAKAATV